MNRTGPDYRVRPAKHVERLLIVDALRRLRSLHPLRDYSYVGFGAHYFVDFTLFHRALGLTTMTSLESRKHLVPRCRFNIPFDSIEVVPEASWDHFGSMEFNVPTIIWADYTGKLEARMLGDIDTLCLRVLPASVIIVTVNVDAEDVESPPQGRMALLEARVGSRAIPLGTREADLDGWKNAHVSRTIIDEQIRASVASRTDGTRYEQLFNFEYRDGARMLTVGGVLVDSDMDRKFADCDWASVDSYRPGEPALRIELPSLTMRELSHLDEQLPLGVDAMKSPGLSKDDLSAYARFYRYYPRYALVDL